MKERNDSDCYVFCSCQDLNFDLDNDILEDVDTQVSVIHTGGCVYSPLTHIPSHAPSHMLTQGIDLDADDDDLLQGD